MKCSTWTPVAYSTGIPSRSLPLIRALASELEALLVVQMSVGVSVEGSCSANGVTGSFDGTVVVSRVEDTARCKPGDRRWYLLRLAIVRNGERFEAWILHICDRD